MHNKEELRDLVKTYYDYQKMRIRIGNRLKVKKNGEKMASNMKSNEKEVSEDRKIILEDIYKNTEETENFVLKAIGSIVKETPLWKSFFKDIKGCGETMAAVILSEIDIKKATTVSKIWAFAGLSSGTTYGKKWNKDKTKIIITDTMVRQDKRTSGFLCPFNQFLRSKLIGVLGSSFTKAVNGNYNKIYYDYHIPEKYRKDKEAMEKRPELAGRYGRYDLSDQFTTEVKKGGKTETLRWKDTTEKHKHSAAVRKMVKIFLQDLYVAWRTLEGLPVRKPYAEEYLGKKHNIV